MRGTTALGIVKGSRHQARCSRCRQPITWAILAARGGKSIPLVAEPVILRTEKNDRDVSVEVLAFDQIHKCSVPRTTHAPRGGRTSAPAPAQKTPPGTPVYGGFTSDRMQQLRDAIDAPKPPADPQQELF